MNRFDGQRRRLTWALAGVFAALIWASAVLVLQSFNRLRFEAFHAQRSLAEEVAGRINADLRNVMSAEETRPPTEYDFLVVSGVRYVQRSPLSGVPPKTALPGVVGYFQVDAEGHFSTPLLPAVMDDLDALELTEAEFEERRTFQERLRRLLEVDEEATQGDLDARLEPEEKAASAPAPRSDDADLDSRRLFRDSSRAEAEANQGIFDQLNSAEAFQSRKPAGAASLGKVAELKLEESLATRVQAAASAQGTPVPSAPVDPAGRNREVRQVTVAASDDLPLTPRISAFQSAVDPFSLALLDDRHFVLYRKVWLEGQRIQGAVIEQAAFLDTVIGDTFAGTTLVRNSDLVVAFEGDVIELYPSASRAGYASESSDLEGSLLLRTRLAAPGDPVELVFSVADLPLGPGATTLVWTSAVMVLVLCGGFYLIYRLGRHHIHLAEQQQDFVSAVSHELKTPLTSIRMYSEILKAGWADEEKKRTYYDFILSESERLSRLIGNVLQLARISRNSTPQVALKEVSVSSLVDQVESKVASALAGAGLTLEQAHEHECLEAIVTVDEDAFMQVMINLVDNAIKFSARAEHRAIELGCRVDGAWVEFRVRDFGPGVAREQMKKIFKLFYRSENELTRETVGTGIGLALVRELMDQMGGSVDVVNRQPGAEFGVRLRWIERPSRPL
jgi:signal transduction histidine kinase